MYYRGKTTTRVSQFIAGFTAFLVIFTLPGAVFAQEASSTETSSTQETQGSATQETQSTQSTDQTQTNEETPCTSGCSQGQNQGAGQGGPTLEDLGGTHDEEGNVVLPSGTPDTRQGATQGAAANSGQNSVEAEASNTNTGSGSTNTAGTAVNNTSNTAITNTANDASAVSASGNTGGNTNSNNTNTGATKTGNANIGVTQVKNDNTAVVGGDVGVAVSGHKGDHNGDLTLDFENAASLLAGDGSSKSVKAVNDATGSDSTNELVFSFEDISDTEVQNDGTINNTVDATAITGQNEANRNTSDGAIMTGDANIAATLVNLLNTTVLNGNVMVSVKDIFGNLTGNINIPDLGQLASMLSGGGSIGVEADNSNTGSGSTNTVDVDVTEEDEFTVENDANIETNVNSTAITGQNEASRNTGGGYVDTGNASVSASNVSIANTTIEGGNWGLVVVNALNKWLGFLVGDNGEVKALSQDETIKEIEARNSNTGSNSDNSIDVDVVERDTETVRNDASITNNVNATAITGQNTANQNTGAGYIKTGDANIKATAVNIANTTVKNANLGIAVVNIFGDWVGDLLYAGKSLFAAAGPSTQVEVEGENENTGANSDNTIDVDVNRSRTTDITNNADISTNLNTTIDTGNNKTNKNTSGGSIETGRGSLALHSRTIANLVGIMDGGVLSVDVQGDNEGTGVESENRINARVNDERVIAVTNDANVNTNLPGMVNTGNNEASDNTIGGEIESGDIAAKVVVDNMINKFIYALGAQVATGSGASAIINGDLSNVVTGSESINMNDVNATRSFLSTLFNDAIVDTIIDLLFNTGGNVSNRNTTAHSSSPASTYQQAGNTDQAPVQEAVAANDNSAANTAVPTSAYVPDNAPAQPYVAAVAGPVGGGQVNTKEDKKAEDDEKHVAAVATSKPTSSVKKSSPQVTPDHDEPASNEKMVPSVIASTARFAPRRLYNPVRDNTAVSRLSSVHVPVYLQAGLEAESVTDSQKTFPTVLVLGTILGTLTGGAAVRRKIG